MGATLPLVVGDSANEVWCAAAARFEAGEGQRQMSRGGATSELLHAILVIEDPRQRWVSSRRPSINPAFAIAEVIWMMAGSNDAALPNYFNPRLPQFAGYASTYHGAYGHRLREAFGIDQLKRAFHALSANPESRQIVLQIWSAERDLPDEQGSPVSPDIPCNLLSLLKVRDGKLEWTQVLRSNDLVLGVPHNIVQFTSLQEVLAGWLGIEMGRYTHFSDSLHVYERDLPRLSSAAPARPEPNRDSLALPYGDSVLHWRELERLTRMLIAPGLTRADVNSLLSSNTLPVAFRNLLMILISDASRRRTWTDQMVHAQGMCTNRALSQLWSGWFKREEERG